MRVPDRITIPSHVVCEVLDGEAVLLNLHSGIYFSLNSTGTRAWQLLQQLGDTEAVLTEVARHSGATGERTRDDLLGWLAELEHNGLIERGT